MALGSSPYEQAGTLWVVRGVEISLFETFEIIPTPPDLPL